MSRNDEYYYTYTRQDMHGVLGQSITTDKKRIALVQEETERWEVEYTQVGDRGNNGNDAGVYENREEAAGELTCYQYRTIYVGITETQDVSCM